MIKVSLPHEGSYYAQLGSFLVGPFNPTSNFDGALPPFRVSTDFLDEETGIFHENNVEHSKTDGELLYIPIMSELIPVPNNIWTNQVRWTCVTTYKPTTPVTLDIYFGLAYPGLVSPVVSGGQYNLAVAVGDRSFTSISASTNKAGGVGPVTSSSLLTLDKRTYVYSRTSAGVDYYTVVQKRRTMYPYSYLKDWKELDNNSALIQLLWDKATGEVTVGPANNEAVSYRYRSLSAPSYSAFEARPAVDALLSSYVDQPLPVVPEEDYGVLAHEASQKVNRNDTNMIAFLKDLRRPMDLIPKLRNLKSLKTHTGNYLGMEYGVLPTISDLKEILGAVSSVKPYLDQNGFSTYTALRRNSASLGGCQVTLEQRIKIAIEKEDSDFQRIANAVESAGFAATLENIWDLVPYSFVLDWFIDVGGFLERCDSRMRLSRLKIRYATMSRKYIIARGVKPTSSVPYIGFINTVHYSRWTTDHCPVPPLFFRNTPTVSNHWLEASALIIQRTKIK